MLDSLPAPESGQQPRVSVLLEEPGWLWMGGVRGELGHSLAPDWWASSWVLDCCGELPLAYREQAARYVPWVFADLDQIPDRFDELQDLCATWAHALRRGAVRGLVILCQYGMNRSGLAAGLVMKALGWPPEDAIARIRHVRPGALNNWTFESLLLGER